MAGHVFRNVTESDNENVLFFCSIFFPETECQAGYNEKRLLHDLLDTYNTLERPVVNESDPLQLSFGLTLMQIIDVVSTQTERQNIMHGNWTT